MIDVSDQDWIDLLAMCRAEGFRLPAGVVRAEVARWVAAGCVEPVRMVARRVGRDHALILRIKAKVTTGSPLGIGSRPFLDDKVTTESPAPTVNVSPEVTAESPLGIGSRPDIECKVTTESQSNINVSFYRSDIPDNDVLLPVVAQKEKKQDRSAKEKNNQSGLFGLASTDRASLVLQRMVDLFNDLVTKKTGNTRKMRQSGRDALAKRLKHHPETQIELVIRWVATSDHNTARFNRENGYAYGETPWIKRHYEEYVEFATEPEPQKPKSHIDQLFELYQEAVDEEQRIVEG